MVQKGTCVGGRKEPLNPKALLSVFYTVLYNLIFLDSECGQCHTLGQLQAVLLTHIMILVISGAMKYTICFFFSFFSQDRVLLSDCILQAGLELAICL